MTTEERVRRIRAATKRARDGLTAAIRKRERSLERLYRRVLDDLVRELTALAGSTGLLDVAATDQVTRAIDGGIRALGEGQRELIQHGLDEAVGIGAEPLTAELSVGALAVTREQTLEYLQRFVAADGLQLSDRIWRLEQGAKQALTTTIQRAIIESDSAVRAAHSLLIEGTKVPPEIRNKINGAMPSTMARQALIELVQDPRGAFRNALRVVRTEMTRAYGESYRAAVSEHPDLVGTRFLLSPNHPRVDECDMHAAVNRHGMGPGVYPVDRSPWPAHPETLSYEEAVFGDEVSEADRAAKENRLAWLLRQSPFVQTRVLHSKKKRAALVTGNLVESQVLESWKTVQSALIANGVDIDAMIAEAATVQAAKRPLSAALEDAVRYVMGAGTPRTREYLYAFDGEGREIHLRAGYSAHVPVPKSLAAGHTVVHNHPNGSTLSPADVAVAAGYGLRDVVAVSAIDGTRYFAHTAAPAIFITRAFNLLFNTARPRFEAWLRAGNDGMLGMNAVIHSIWRTLAQLDVMSYRTTHRGDWFQRIDATAADLDLEDLLMTTMQRWVKGLATHREREPRLTVLSDLAMTVSPQDSLSRIRGAISQTEKMIAAGEPLEFELGHLKQILAIARNLRSDKP